MTILFEHVMAKESEVLHRGATVLEVGVVEGFADEGLLTQDFSQWKVPKNQTDDVHGKVVSLIAQHVVDDAGNLALVRSVGHKVHQVVVDIAAPSDRLYAKAERGDHKSFQKWPYVTTTTTSSSSSFAIFWEELRLSLLLLLLSLTGGGHKVNSQSPEDVNLRAENGVLQAKLRQQTAVVRLQAALDEVAGEDEEVADQEEKSNAGGGAQEGEVLAQETPTSVQPSLKEIIKL
ncbi:hypothetical protein TYRP_020919 [Tyrophagus putrescentiae]|nr:hypothetical protein TYRP_020919 [Tyrophagus putrescentiae]